LVFSFELTNNKVTEHLDKYYFLSLLTTPVFNQKLKTKN